MQVEHNLGKANKLIAHLGMSAESNGFQSGTFAIILVLSGICWEGSIVCSIVGVLWAFASALECEDSRSARRDESLPELTW